MRMLFPDSVIGPSPVVRDPVRWTHKTKKRLFRLNGQVEAGLMRVMSHNLARKHARPCVFVCVAVCVYVCGALRLVHVCWGLLACMHCEDGGVRPGRAGALQRAGALGALQRTSVHSPVPPVVTA